MPTGKVKWYDAEKGFGFLSQDDGGDVYVGAAALPDGVTTRSPSSWAAARDLDASGRPTRTSTPESRKFSAWAWPWLP